MRRSAVAEGAQEEAEFLVSLFGREAKQSEDLGLDDRVVAADGAAGGFLAVDHQVVSLGADLGGIAVKQVQIFGHRHRERMMFGGVSPRFRVPGQERKTDDPRIMKRLGVVKLELRGQPGAQVRQGLAGHGLGVGNDQYQVTRPGIKTLAQFCLGLGREELGGGTGHGLGLDLEPDQALGPERACILGQPVEVLAAVLLAAAGAHTDP